MTISKKTKSIISGILLVAIIAGVLALAGSFLGKDTKTISSTEFSVGGINTQGNYVESKTSIYTKDMFECQGLSIEPDFEATGTYQVFYYDSQKNFIDSTIKYNSDEGVYKKGNTFGEAKYARIMITPDVPTDDDGKEVEDFKIRFYEVVGYANDYNITVDKKQNFSLYSDELDEDYDVVTFDYIGRGNNTSSGFSPNTNSPYHWYGDVDLTTYSEMIIKLEDGYVNGSVNVGDEVKSNIMVSSAEPLGFYGAMNTLSYEIVHSVDDYVYILVDIGDLGVTRFSTTFVQEKGVSVWVR